MEGVHLLLPGYGENGPALEIYQYKNIENQDFVSPNKRGCGHIAFEVESVEAVRISTFGPIKSSNNIKRGLWLKKVEELGKEMK